MPRTLTVNYHGNVAEAELKDASLGTLFAATLGLAESVVEMDADPDDAAAASGQAEGKESGSCQGN